jgi:NAD(P)H-dependent FMN reductase
MIVVLSATNRPGSNTRKVADVCVDHLRTLSEEVQLLDLADLPQEIFTPHAYATKPPEFAPWQQTILDADGILVVVPEYNGSFPGIVKYFIDMLKFPESLYETPCGFIGLASGQFGALRSVEQLEMIFQYRHAHLFGRRCFLSAIHRHLDEDGRLVEPDLEQRVQETVAGFAEFCRRLKG